jgi:hypothetical protein
MVIADGDLIHPFSTPYCKPALSESVRPGDARPRWSAHHIGAPNSEPHLMVASGTAVDAHVRVASILAHADASVLHFVPATTCWKLQETRR